MHVASRRTWSLSDNEYSYPGASAKLLNTTEEDLKARLQVVRVDYNVSVSIEAAAVNDPDLRTVLDTVDWRLLPANRVAFALLDRPGADEFDSEARAYIRDGFNTFGDSAIIENTHNVWRRMTSAQSNEVSSECRRRYHCIVSTVLQERGIDTVDIDHECEEAVALTGMWKAPPRSSFPRTGRTSRWLIEIGSRRRQRAVSRGFGRGAGCDISTLVS